MVKNKNKRLNISSYLKACLSICIDDFNSYLKSIIMTFLTFPHFTLLFPRIFESVKRIEKSHTVVPEFPVTSAVKDAVKISWAKIWLRERTNRILKYRSSLRDIILNIDDTDSLWLPGNLLSSPAGVIKRN